MVSHAQLHAQYTIQTIAEFSFILLLGHSLHDHEYTPLNSSSSTHTAQNTTSHATMTQTPNQPQTQRGDAVAIKKGGMASVMSGAMSGRTRMERRNPSWNAAPTHPTRRRPHQHVCAAPRCNQDSHAGRCCTGSRHLSSCHPAHCRGRQRHTCPVARHPTHCHSVGRKMPWGN